MGVALLLLGSSASTAAAPTIEAAGGSTGPFSWSPSHDEVGTGGEVAFRSTNATVPHGLTWTGGPDAPSCTGVPIEAEKTNWSGSCTFDRPGTYTFQCYVHPTEMKGTITVTGGGTQPPPTQPLPGGPEAPAPGPATLALRLDRHQTGNTVRGSVDLTQAGGRLTVELLAARSKVFGSGKAGTVPVGRLVRPSTSSGSISFAVGLKPPAKRALRELGSLPVSVSVTLRPVQGEELQRKRGIVMKGGVGK